MYYTRFVAVVIVFFHLSAYSQTIELSGGYMLNHMYDTEGENPHWRADYTNGGGFSIVMAMEDIRLDILRMRFSLAYEKYDGKSNAYNSGLGSGGGNKVAFDKSLISLQAFPVGFRIFKELDIYIGLQFSWLLNEEFSGSGSWYAGVWPYYGNYDLEDKYEKFNSSWYFGLTGRISYNIRIARSLYICPQYSYYLGLSPEFRELPEEARSMRHFFGLGIEKRLEKKTKDK